MQQSIKTFLVINMLVAVTLILSLAIISNLLFDQQKQQKSLDIHLVYTGLSIASFIKHINLQDEQELIQTSIDHIAMHANELLPYDEQDPEMARYVNTQFQVWYKNELIVKSQSIPSESIANISDSFTTKSINGSKWRIFTLNLPNKELTIVVADNYQLYEQLENRITRSSILIMLISYPILGLLIWFIVARALKSIKYINREIKHRQADFLKPIRLKNVPIEIQPFIDELNALLDKLHDAFIREKRFTSDAAHELRTPLAALKAQVVHASQTDSIDEKNRYLKKIQHSVERNARIIEQLLTLTRITPETNLEGFQNTEICQIAREAIAEIYPTAMNKNTDIELITSGNEIFMASHPTSIEILLRNLIENSIKYCPENSSIKVVIEQHHKSVSLSVIDNGPGIDDTIQKTLFDRFVRGEHTQIEGSGLGLGIVKQITDLHKATIKISIPDSGQGLNVTVNFPKIK